MRDLEPAPVEWRPQRSGAGGFLRDILETLIPAVLLALLISHFIAQTTYVYGYSMEPNLHDQQRLIVEKMSYHFHTPRRGDIVIIDMGTGEIPLIKRVIGLPGETVEIQDNQVLINGQPLAEPYLSNVRQYDYGPVQVPAGYFFAMGDNRSASADSRTYGPFAVDRILGRAWLSYWPLEDAGPVN